MHERIAVLGGGIGGLSAAHELVERGFEVDVYEKRDQFGGKARSMPVPDTGTSDTNPLPGEHGFRFFPAFYRHIFDTMRRIPYATNENGVFDNLVETTQWMIAREGEREFEVPVEFEAILDDWQRLVDALIGDSTDIPMEERVFFADRLYTFLTTCEERRREEYDDVSWWEFVEADGKSEQYKQSFAIGPTRSLVAMQAEQSSTRTIGRIYIQLLLGIILPWLEVDRLLDGPTSDVWIDPWVEYLEESGVTFHPNTTVEGVTLRDGRISSVTVRNAGTTSEVTADAYIAAVPVEVMSDLCTDDLVSAAPSLADIDDLQTAWMNGIQFYLNEPASITHGHIIYEGSPWALTSIDQHDFWDVDFSDYGTGDVAGIISVCISNWNTPGTVVDKPAKECTPAEIKREVWTELKDWWNESGNEVLHDDQLVDWFLDPDIQFPAPNETTNAEPLLVNTVGSFEYRPNVDLEVPNLFLAADYVRTNTDLATMEAANEAARRAVNGILETFDRDDARCEVWPLEEPDIFAPMKQYDRIRYKMGRAHQDAPLQSAETAGQGGEPDSQPNQD